MINKLYHYTSINNLALILSSKSIRFGRADKVNDAMEGLSSDFNSLASYIFISCWTNNKEENLALWNMYTPQMRGVRIELSLPIFNSHKTAGIENLLFSHNEAVNEEKGIFIYGGENVPYPIEYTDEDEKLIPNIRTPIGLQVDQLGKFKNKIWSFEEEYRYRLDINPIDKNVQTRDFLQRYAHLIEKGIPPSIESYFITISDISFTSMKVITSPKIISGDKEIIEALIEKYNPSATIFESKLTGYIR